MKRIIAVVFFLVTSSIVSLAQTPSRADLFKKIETKRTELRNLETLFLAPTAEDREAHVQFLAQPNSGLIRLLPREKYDPDTYKKSGLTIRGGGSYYSFTRQTHEYGFGTQIGLEQGYLKVGFAGADYGMLAKLDGAHLEDVSTESAGVIFLAKYSAVTNEPDARVEQRKFATGATVDGLAYKNRLPVEIGATYLLRSINFGESDVLVAFRAARQDTDGSLIIAWKLLQKFDVPRLAKNKP